MPKIYVPKSSAKSHVFPDGGEIINLSFGADALCEFIEANRNAKGYLNLSVSKRKAVGQVEAGITVDDVPF